MDKSVISKIYGFILRDLFWIMIFRLGKWLLLWRNCTRDKSTLISSQVFYDGNSILMIYLMHGINMDTYDVMWRLNGLRVTFGIN